MPEPPRLHVVGQQQRACDECRLRPNCFPDHLKGEFAEHAASVIRPRAPVPRGTYLFRQGMPVTAFYFLRSGSAKAIVTEGDGRESIMSFLFPTDLVGSASMDQTVYHDSVVTLERSSFCELRIGDLSDLFRRDPPTQRAFLAKVSSSILNERHARLRLEHSSAGERMADFLLELSDRLLALGRDPYELQLSMSRYDIANYIGLAPETVSRVLRRFDDEGFISVRHKQLSIREPGRLRELAAPSAHASGD
ncbi:MAG: helix-turn-helix domain-containing protein [Gammaproteobacteria bacterium]